MRSLFFFSCAMLALPLAVACSASDSPSANGAEDDLIEGRVAADADFPSTMQVIGNCTVSRIGERLILTAAHCVRNADGTLRSEFREGQTMNVRTRGADAGTRALKIVRTVIHPQIFSVCSTRVGGCGGRASDERRDAPDVGVIEVEGGLEGVAIARIDTSTAEPDDEVTILGYGCTGDVWGGSDGQLRFLDTRIVRVEASIHEGGLRADEEQGIGNIRENYAVTPGPQRISSAASPDAGEDAGGEEAGVDAGVAPSPAAGLCPGDSGGALYRKGTDLIVGVNASYTFLPSGRIPVTNWHARVDGNSRWGVAAWLESMGASMSRPCSEASCRPSASQSSADAGADASSDAGSDASAGDGG